jgi:hypothetical protein
MELTSEHAPHWDLLLANRALDPYVLILRKHH